MAKLGLVTLFLTLVACNFAVASETKPSTGAEGWRNPDRHQVRRRNLVKVQLEGIHLEVKDNATSRVQGIKTIPFYGLKVKRVVDKKGKEITDFRGAAVVYYDSKKAKEFVAKHRSGQQLTIHGRLDFDLGILEIEKVEFSTQAESPSKEDKSIGNER